MRDLLQKKIDVVRKNLSEKTRSIIDSSNWRSIILKMINKYNLNQIKYLETETELLLYGILEPEKYQKNIRDKMEISENEVIKLLNELNNLIFKKIEKKLINNIPIKNNNEILTSVPKKIKNNSNYQIEIYKIGKKYNLHIDQIGVFEKIINSVISGELSSKKFEEELKSKISLDSDKLFNIINDVNQSIFKNIRDNFKSEWEERKIKNNQTPTPPYKKESNDIPIPPYKKERGREIRQEEKDMLKDMGVDLIEEKLTKPTKNKDTVSDYSLPKMSMGSSISNQKRDLYRKEI